MTFDQWFRDNVTSEFFGSHELLAKGSSHFQRGSKAFQKNTDPPRELWDNCIPLVRVLNRLRSKLGVPVSLLSVYRSPAYNAAIGGAKFSQHKDFKAADVVCKAPPAQVAKALRELRSAGLFKGGIGTYRTFTHVDVRGNNVDWTG